MVRSVQQQKTISRLAPETGLSAPAHALLCKLDSTQSDHYHLAVCQIKKTKSQAKEIFL